MAGMLRMRRSRGVLSGTLLVLLGLWGALIPFVGPYFHFGYTPDATWTYNTGRLWLEILPGAATFVGGVLLIIAIGRHIALFGALLAAAAGAWFALGTLLIPLWSTNTAGVPIAGTLTNRVLEQVALFIGLGVVIVFVAAVAAGLLTAVPGISADDGLDRPQPTRRVPAHAAGSDDTQTVN